MIMSGTIIKDTLIRATKKRKKHNNRDHRGTDASSDSPDPSGPRTQVPTRLTPQGLGLKFRLARPLPGLGAGPHSTWEARLPPHGTVLMT